MLLSMSSRFLLKALFLLSLIHLTAIEKLPGQSLEDLEIQKLPDLLPPELIGQVLRHKTKSYSFTDVVDLSADGSTVLVGSSGIFGISTVETSHLSVFRVKQNQWELVDTTISYQNPPILMRQSSSISGDGNRIVVAENDKWPDVRNGNVSIYDYIDNKWIKDTQRLLPERPTNSTIISVDISDSGAVAAFFAFIKKADGKIKKEAYVYQKTEGAWQQLGDKITGNENDSSVLSQIKLSARGDKIVVIFTISNKRIVRAYSINDSKWEQIKSDIVLENAPAEWGNPISISKNGHRLAIGSSNEDGPEFRSGKVRVYDLQPSGWELAGKVLEGKRRKENFGQSVDLSDEGDRLIVGAAVGPFSSKPGIVRVYLWQHEKWALEYEIKGKKTLEWDQVGFHVGISRSGKTILFSTDAFSQFAIPGGNIWVLELSE